MFLLSEKREEAINNISKGLNLILDNDYDVTILLETMAGKGNEMGKTFEELKAIMAHNRDEEIEHACMTLEWLRRNMGAWDEELKTYLFTTGPITQIEGQAEEKIETSNIENGLNIGKMK